MFAPVAALSRAAALLAALVVPVASAAAADSDRIDSRIEMYAIAGIHVLTIEETLSEAADHYAITMALQSRGIADLFANIKSHTEVTGHIVQGKIIPETYTSDIARSGKAIATRATFGPAGALSANMTPASTTPRTPVTPDQLRGTVDEHTAYYELARQLAQSGSCALTIAVYDGLHRFNLQFADLPATVALDHPVRRYSGPTKGCGVTRHPISGFPIDTSDREGMDHGRMWFARLMPGFLTPVQMEFDTELGVITGYLAELHGRGVDLALMK